MRTKLICAAAFAAIATVLVAQPSKALTLEEAIAAAVASNPQIGEAIYNRQAIGFELRQAKGLFLPRVDLELRGGIARYRTPATIPNGLEDDFNTREVRLAASQRIFDGFAALSEVQRQAARLDSASHRVFERSEFIALAVAREYIDIVRLRILIQRAQENLSFHVQISTDVNKATQGGATSIADQQQAQERVLAARARVDQIRDDLSQAESRFIQLVGLPIGNTATVPRLSKNIPNSLDKVLGVARVENPLLKLRTADLDAALAQVRGADANFYPRVTAELSTRKGKDVDNVNGKIEDHRAEVVARWNLFSGGIDTANREEQIRRASEARMIIHTAHREVEHECRSSWERRIWLRSQLNWLSQQSNVSRQLLGSYQEQFRIGARSLLDLLDTQNTAYATQAALLTAQYAEIFTEYRLLASMGMLVKTFKVSVSKDANANARTEHAVPPTPDSDPQPRFQLQDPWWDLRFR
ncbi:MAG: TolC family outer membrane protein [Xanthobacteraceae bacterium]|nr:TolC family outer membrane protein [Xanthobacteraceae bacterium]